jgi:GT2 family glycosyltransferase
MFKVAIAITCFNQSRYTRRAIESLLETTKDDALFRYDYAVFDDSSTDDTAEVVVRTGGQRMTYWCSHENSGLTHIWNAIYRMYSGHDYIAIINNDVIFAPDWITRILSVMIESKCQMAGPVSNGPGHIKAQDVRRFITGYEPSDQWEDIRLVSEHIKWEQPFCVKRINGFCMVFLTDFLRFAQKERSGMPFDPKNRNFGNEDEIQDRLQPTSLIVPSSFVFHYKRVSIEGRPRDFSQFRAG